MLFLLMIVKNFFTCLSIVIWQNHPWTYFGDYMYTACNPSIDWMVIFPWIKCKFIRFTTWIHLLLINTMVLLIQYTSKCFRRRMTSFSGSSGRRWPAASPPTAAGRHRKPLKPQLAFGSSQWRSATVSSGRWLCRQNWSYTTERIY